LVYPFYFAQMRVRYK